MRILLVRPPQPKETHGLKNVMITEPLELEYVGACVPDHEVRIFDMIVDTNLDNEIRQFKPQILGTTCYINNVLEALSVCYQAKKIDSTIITVIGGVHAALNPDEFAYSYVDFIIQGEGMTTFKKLVNTVEGSRNYDSVAGIVYNDGDTFVKTKFLPFPVDVDAFPFPNRELTRRYRNDYYYFTWNPLVLIRSSWGCPFKCNFCYNRQLTDDKYFARSAESFVKELETIESKHVFIIDDTFFHNRKRLEKIYTMIKERGIKKEFLAYSRTDFLANNKEILKKWASIGMHLIRVGMEAVTDEELASYDKNNSMANNLKALEVCREVGIDISASFIMQPHYDKEDFKKIERFVLDNGMVYIFINPLTPLPGIAFSDQYESSFIAPHKKAYPLWDFQHCVLKPTKLTLRQYYWCMGKIYLKATNPFRLKKLQMNKRPTLSIFSIKGLKFYIGLIRILLEVFFAYRQHKKVLKRNIDILYKPMKIVEQDEVYIAN